jgi:hypothetical protein
MLRKIALAIALVALTSGFAFQTHRLRSVQHDYKVDTGIEIKCMDASNFVNCVNAAYEVIEAVR